MIEEMVHSHVFLTSPSAVPTFAVSNIAALKGVQSQANVSLLIFCADLVVVQSSKSSPQQLHQHILHRPVYYRQKQLMVVLVLTRRASVHVVYNYYHQLSTECIQTSLCDWEVTG